MRLILILICLSLLLSSYSPYHGYRKNDWSLKSDLKGKIKKLTIYSYSSDGRLHTTFVDYYDEKGDILRRCDTQWSYDKSDIMVGNVIETSFVYDKKGQLISEQRSSRAPGTLNHIWVSNYSYDTKGRLIATMHGDEINRSYGDRYKYKRFYGFSRVDWANSRVEYRYKYKDSVETLEYVMRFSKPPLRRYTKRTEQKSGIRGAYVIYIHRKISPRYDVIEHSEYTKNDREYRKKKGKWWPAGRSYKGTYDNDGRRLTAIERHGSEEPRLTAYTYSEFDIHNNPLKIIKDESGEHTVTTRQIEYYP